MCFYAAYAAGYAANSIYNTWSVHNIGASNCTTVRQGILYENHENILKVNLLLFCILFLMCDGKGFVKLGTFGKISMHCIYIKY